MRTHVVTTGIRRLAFVFVMLGSTLPSVADSSNGQAGSAFLTAKAVVEGWESTYGGSSPMAVSYTHEYLGAPAGTEPVATPSAKWVHVERTEDGARYRMRYSIAEAGFADERSVMAHSFDGKATRGYWGNTRTGIVSPGLSGRDVESMNQVKQYLLISPAVRLKDEKTLVPAGTPTFSRVFRDFAKGGDISDDVVIRPLMERVGGESCHVIERAEKIGDRYTKTTRVWVAQDKGMIPMKYEMLLNGEAVQVMQVERLGEAETKAGPVWYPAEATLTTGMKIFGFAQYRLNVSSFVPNVSVQDETFCIEFPAGSRVADRVLDLYYVVGNIHPGPDPDQPMVELSSRRLLSAGGAGSIEGLEARWTADSQPSTKPSSEPSTKPSSDRNKSLPSVRSTTWSSRGAVVAMVVGGAILALILVLMARRLKWGGER